MDSSSKCEADLRHRSRRQRITNLPEPARTPLLPLLVIALALPALLPDRLAAQPLPGTEPLTVDGDLAAQMVEGIDRFLAKETSGAVARREAQWKRDFSSREAYESWLFRVFSGCPAGPCAVMQFLWDRYRPLRSLA